MTLLIQVIGALVLGGLLGSLMPPDWPGRTAVGLTAVAVAVTGIAFWNGVWPTSHAFIDQAKTYPSSIWEGNVAPGSLYPANVKLLTAAEKVIPRNASFYMFATPGAVGDSGEWVGYQLSPRVLVKRMQEAEYTLVYGASPTTVRRFAHLPVILDRSDGGVVRNTMR